VNYRLSFPIAAMLLMASACAARQTGLAEQWQPVSQEELKMTGVPGAPGAPAIILYRQVDRDDSTRPFHEYNYIRMKVFNVEGRNYGDVEIPFFEKNEKIYDIKARTIRPDGTIVDFDGKALDKEIVKARGFKYSAKTFALPDVQPGSIIEYRYASDLRYLHNSQWKLSQDLFTKHARFSLKRYPLLFALQWTWPNGLPEGCTTPARDGAVIRLDCQNVPAFEVEDNMPPEGTMKYKVDFIYTDPTLLGDPPNFWSKLGMRLNEEVETFIAKHKAIDEAVPHIVSPSDEPEVKLKKLYARAQQIRNVSYERERTEQELKREKEKEIKNVEDIWKQGRGDLLQINWAFLALARAAGFDASAVWVASRDEDFFNPKLMKGSALDATLVLVNLQGKNLFLDPGAIFTSFGLLPWEETGVKGLKLDKNGGTWITTPFLDSGASRIERRAELKLSSQGSLEGKLTITYSGLEAAWRRYVEREEDDAARKKFLENEIRESVPATIETELTNKPDWTSSSPVFAAEFNLKVPGWISSAGHRALFPAELFGAAEKHMCEHATRVHPPYFPWKLQKIDDVRIELPQGWQVSSLPKPQSGDASLVSYNLSVENDKRMLHVVRTLTSDVISLEPSHYDTLHSFYQAVRTGDEQQIVLQPATPAASN